MDLSATVRFVMMRAQAESAAAHNTGIGVEHLFLGLLKLAEIDASAFMAGVAPREEIQADIDRVTALFAERGVETGRARRQMRDAITQGQPTGETEVAAMLDHAASIMLHDNAATLRASDILRAILEEPTPMILEICALGDSPDKAEDSSGESGGEDTDEMSKAFLPALTGRIRRMRAELLAKVHGQDHVVHAFAEGMFAAEVLAASDEKRKRPRALFVFAGPPGVGKTFLAEQAAEALKIPFKRFDMSSYSDHQSYMGLIGFEPSYKDAKAGTLTEFVKDNPHCILLFDEIEKAHTNTIQLFLQVLDAGRLADRYMDEEIAFRDTIIIFTTNATRSLYEGNRAWDASSVPRQTIVSALETEKNPQTGEPFFPGAICSRMATGWVLLFNHLRAQHLEKISAAELARMCELFQKQYGVDVSADPLVPTTLLFSGGGQLDARMLRAQTEMFFKNELFKLCRLWGDASFTDVLGKLKRIRFSVEMQSIPDDVRPIYECSERHEILVYADAAFGARCIGELKEYTVHTSSDPDKALQIAGERDVRVILLDLFAMGAHAFDGESQRDYGAEPSTNFDSIPMSARLLHVGTALFRSLRERLPELPVYLLESEAHPIDAELLMSFVRAGARGKLHMPEENFSVLEDELTGICANLYRQQIAARLGAEHKVLNFETAPKLSHDKREVTIRLRDLTLKRALSADDSEDVLSDIERPQVRFDDVIGATDAKDELRFFVDYLRNPKKFTAQGLKPPKGVLLYGPPGTGKTLLSRAMAGESDVAFISASASSFVTAYQGSGSESVRSLFKRARRYAPAIIFIDEFDAIGRARGGAVSAHEEEMALNTMLTEMDGFTVDPKRPVFVLAATNYDVEQGKGGPGVIDPALVRRFDRAILVDLPNKDDRKKYLTVMLKKNRTHCVSETMIERLAGRSTGMSLANMAAVLETASRMAVKQGKPLDDAILDEAYELTRHGAEKDWGRDYLERVARHESGHALLCCMAGNTPAYLTIVARGEHGGYMEHSEKDMSPLQTRKELLGRIRTSLGGRAAEIVYYGDEDGISTGASGDLEGATRLARAMICSYGMDETIGLAVLTPEEATRGPLAAKIGERVSAIIAREMEETIRILWDNKARIDALVAALLDRNKLTREEIEGIVGSAPQS